MKFGSLSAQERSYIMGRIRSKDTKPELLVRRYLHAQGLRYRLHDAALPGKPDLVLPGRRVVVFVQGCFWHLHGSACGKPLPRPRANAAQWQAKLEGNAARDERHRRQLEAAGWRVLTVWECELRRAQRGATLHRLTREITAGDTLAAEEQWDELGLAA